MRQLLPGRYNLDDATFSRASTAYDDAGRLAGLAVPRITKTAYGKMLINEEGTTNLLTNPKMGSVIGWETSYGGILELITTSPNGNFPNYAEACLKGTVASGQTNCYMYQILTLLLNTTYTATVWVFVPSSIIGVARLNMSVYAGSSMAVLVISERDQWVKKTVTWTTNNIDTNYSFGIGSVYGNPGDSVYACIAALEQKSYPTSWTPASRAAESLTMPVLATNLLTPNLASVESGTTGFTANTGAETITRDTTEYKYGSASLKVVTPGNVINEGFYISQISVSASLAYTISLWAKGTGTIKLILYEYTSTGSAVGATTVTVTLSDIWTRYSVTRSLGSTGALVRLLVQTLTVQAITFYADGLQLELGPYATTWNLPAGATPRMGLPVEHGTIEGIVEITDIVKRAIGYCYLFNLYHSGSERISVLYLPNGLWQLATISTTSTTGTCSGSLTPNGMYYYKCYYSSVEAQLEFWNLTSSSKVATINIASPVLPTAYSEFRLGRFSTGEYVNTRFGKHLISNIARTDDPDFNNLMPRDGNTVGIFDPTYSFLT